MKLNNLYSLAEQKKISVIAFSMKNKKALCMRDIEGDCIAMDFGRIETEREEKELLAEEYEHIDRGLLYCLSDIRNPLYRQNIDRIEHLAHRAAAIRLMPLNDLKSALNKGLKENWEIAEYFDVSEDVVKTAINYYQTKGMFKITK